MKRGNRRVRVGNPDEDVSIGQSECDNEIRNIVCCVFLIRSIGFRGSVCNQSEVTPARTLPEKSGMGRHHWRERKRAVATLAGRPIAPRRDSNRTLL